MASGDPARIRAVFKMFGERFAQQKKGGAPAVKQPTKVVPGTAGAQEPKGWDYGKFAGASSDDQARMLMDMGLVDKEES
ncbi:hypothetical protein SDC9_173569 [bioreactor metagenome]|uniref:Uncharacterized protein n=2 Tax=root TaxID=1 RepID=A0A645GHH4_9ZZZZ